MTTEVIRSFVIMPEPLHFALLQSALFNKEGARTGSDRQQMDVLLKNGTTRSPQAQPAMPI